MSEKANGKCLIFVFDIQKFEAVLLTQFQFASFFPNDYTSLCSIRLVEWTDNFWSALERIEHLNKIAVLLFT